MVSDMAALAGLIARVQVGWSVDVTNHDYMHGSGSGRVTRVSGDMYGTGEAGYFSIQSGQPHYYVWPNAADDFEIDGDTLRVYNPNHAYVHGQRAVVLTLAFRAA